MLDFFMLQALFSGPNLRVIELYTDATQEDLR
jgi:hypothetical protein